MITETENSIEVLGSLIEINNNRINGFTKAIKKLGHVDKDLISTFEDLIDDSKKFKQELIAEISKTDRNYLDNNNPSDLSESVYSVWRNTSSIFNDNDRQSILLECQRGEDALRNAYKDAILDNELDKRQIDLIKRQANEIANSDNKIKSMAYQQE